MAGKGGTLKLDKVRQIPALRLTSAGPGLGGPPSSLTNQMASGNLRFLSFSFLAVKC